MIPDGGRGGNRETRSPDSMRSHPGPVEEARFRRKGRRLFTLAHPEGSIHPWDPSRSKLAALIIRDRTFTESFPLIHHPIPGGSVVLYLGGGHGTTVSHLSDLAPGGRIYVVEFGITIRGILDMAGARDNVFPIMEDARCPGIYRHLLGATPVDLLYQDVAQPCQYPILRAHMPFLRTGGIFVLMLKVKSISQSGDARDIAEGMAEAIRKECSPGFVTITDLTPYQRDHMAIWGRR